MRRRKKAGCFPAALDCLFMSIALGFFIAAGVDTVVLNSKPKAPAPAAGTIQRIQYDLGEDYSVRLAGDSFMIEIDAPGGYMGGMIRDITRALKAIDESGIPYSDISVSVFTGFVDKLGNTRKGRAIYASYSHQTVSRINWKNFLPENVLDVADSKAIHPAFKD